jgi:hypothetical protein
VSESAGMETELAAGREARRDESAFGSQRGAEHHDQATPIRRGPGVVVDHRVKPDRYCRRALGRGAPGVGPLRRVVLGHQPARRSVAWPGQLVDRGRSDTGRNPAGSTAQPMGNRVCVS